VVISVKTLAFGWAWTVLLTSGVTLFAGRGRVPYLHDFCIAGSRLFDSLRGQKGGGSGGGVELAADAVSLVRNGAEGEAEACFRLSWSSLSVCSIFWFLRRRTDRLLGCG